MFIFYINVYEFVDNNSLKGTLILLRLTDKPVSWGCFFFLNKYLSYQSQ